MHQSQLSLHSLRNNLTVHLELWPGNHFIWCNATYNSDLLNVSSYVMASRDFVLAVQNGFSQYIKQIKLKKVNFFLSVHQTDT